MKDLNEQNRISCPSLNSPSSYSKGIVKRYRRDVFIRHTCRNISLLGLLILFLFPTYLRLSGEINYVKSQTPFAFSIEKDKQFNFTDIKITLSEKIDFFSNVFPEIEELSELELKKSELDKDVITAISSFNGPAKVKVTYLNNGIAVKQNELKFWFY